MGGDTVVFNSADLDSRDATAAFDSAVAALFGIIHSPFPGSPAGRPWTLENSIPMASAGGYILAGIMGLLLATRPQIDDA